MSEKMQTFKERMAEGKRKRNRRKQKKLVQKKK